MEFDTEGYTVAAWGNRDVLPEWHSRLFRRLPEQHLDCRQWRRHRAEIHA
jgi:hypothetical protein